MATEAVVVLKYILKFFIPVHLAFLPDVEPARMTSLSFIVSGFLIFLALLSCLPGRLKSIWSLGILWIFICLAPSSSLVPLKDFMAEHRFYTASAGACMAVVALLSKAVPFGSNNSLKKWVLCGAAASVILASITLHRNYTYSDEIRILRDAVSHSPGSAGLLSDLGYKYFLRGESRRAIRHLNRALENEPDNFRALNHNGLAWTELGEYDLALEYFKRASENTARPGRIYANIGMVYLKKGQPEKAMPWLREAARDEPYIGDIHFNLAQALAGVDLHEHALQEFRLAARLSEPRPEIYFEMGRAYISVGKLREAKESFTISLKLNPGFAPAQMALQQLRIIEMSKKR